MPELSFQWLLVLVLFIAFAALAQLSKVSREMLRKRRPGRRLPKDSWFTPNRMMWLSLIMLIAAMVAAGALFFFSGLR